MTWVIKAESGKILTKLNGEYLVFDTAYDAMVHIDTACQSSPYLKPYKLYKKNKKHMV